MLKKQIRVMLLLSFLLLSFGLTIQAATPKDVLVVAQIAEPKSMAPATVTAVNDFRILLNVYDGWFVIEAEHLRSNPASLSPGQSVMMEKSTHSHCAKELNFTMAVPSTQKRSSLTLIVCWSKITPTLRPDLFPYRSSSQQSRKQLL
jgi:ABC-type oligopeptide transport system substrate-binding subunit